MLARPGASCVIVAEMAGVLKVALMPAAVGGSLDAVMKVEILDRGLTLVSPDMMAGANSLPEPETSATAPAPASSDIGPALLAHIARRGDVQIAPGAWVAGPSAPAGIEGLMIHPSDRAPRIEIQARMFGHDSGWTEWAAPGTFVGSRARAMPLVGLRCRIAEANRDQWSLAADANFLGAPQLTRAGKEVELSGPFGNEALVGLRLRLSAVAEGASVPAAAAKEPRVKVFRAGSVVR